MEIVAGGRCDDSEGYFIEPTVAVVQDPKHDLMRTEYFGPLLGVYVYEDARVDETLELCATTSPYALTGAIFADDRQAVRQAIDALRFAAGNFYVNDKPTGAVVGQQPFGGSRASGTNDKAGSILNLLPLGQPADDQRRRSSRRPTGATRSSAERDRIPAREAVPAASSARGRLDSFQRAPRSRDSVRSPRRHLDHHGREEQRVGIRLSSSPIGQEESPLLRRHEASRDERLGEVTEEGAHPAEDAQPGPPALTWGRTSTSTNPARRSAAGRRVATQASPPASA